MTEPNKRPELEPLRLTPTQIVLFVAGSILVAPGIAIYVYVNLFHGNIYHHLKLLVAVAVPAAGLVGGIVSYVFSRRNKGNHD